MSVPRNEATSIAFGDETLTGIAHVCCRCGSCSPLSVLAQASGSDALPSLFTGISALLSCGWAGNPEFCEKFSSTKFSNSTGPKSARPLQSTQQISVQNIKLSMFHANFPSFLCLVIIGERMIAPMKYRNLQLAVIAVPHRNHARDRGRGVVTLLVMG